MALRFQKRSIYLLAFVAAFMSMCTVRASSEVVLGPPQVFPHPIKEIRGYKSPEPGSLSVAPNHKQVAVIRRFDCDLYELDEKNYRWLGPYAGNLGGFIGTRANPDNVRPGTPERVERAKLPRFGWTAMPDGSQAFVVNPFFRRAIKLAGGAIQNVPSPPPVVENQFDPVTGKTRLVKPGTYAETEQRYKNLYTRMKAKNAMSRGTTAPGGSIESQVPDEVYGIFSPSPDGIHILCHLQESESPFVCLSTATGERVSYPIQNGRPRALPEDTGGSFSADGKYVLMSYNYGPDDHYDGGYLQLFTREGEFVIEIAEYYHGLFQPTGYHSWLSNGWLVYSNGRELVFQKITVSE